MILPVAEQWLSDRDVVLADVIQRRGERWPETPSEPPVWGLLRIVMAQQLSTLVACRLAERVAAGYPHLLRGHTAFLEIEALRGLGLPMSRAVCCAQIAARADQLLEDVASGVSWPDAVRGIKGIGPWTMAVFRIMVLREPDVLPTGDVGLIRAIQNTYGEDADISKISDVWRPYRSVGCWYLWRTLGNQQLG
jgi:DNA-3-methyladenine glycosylase II